MKLSFVSFYFSKRTSELCIGRPESSLVIGTYCLGFMTFRFIYVSAKFPIIQSGSVKLQSGGCQHATVLRVSMSRVCDHKQIIVTLELSAVVPDQYVNGKIKIHKWFWF